MDEPIRGLEKLLPSHKVGRTPSAAALTVAWQRRGAGCALTFDGSSQVNIGEPQAAPPPRCTTQPRSKCGATVVLAPHPLTPKLGARSTGGNEVRMDPLIDVFAQSTRTDTEHHHWSTQASPPLCAWPDSAHWLRCWALRGAAPHGYGLYTAG